LRDVATSLAIAARRRVDRVCFTATLLDALEADHRRFVAGGFAVLRPEWERRSVLAGRAVTVRAADTEVAGTVAGVDDDGALRLVDAGGTVRRVIAGEVTLRPSG